MLFDKAKKLMVLKSDLNDNASILKANGKIFKNISTLSKYIKTFGFCQDFLIMKIDKIKYCKFLALRLSDPYARIVQKFLDDKL